MDRRHTEDMETVPDGYGCQPDLSHPVKDVPPKQGQGRTGPLGSLPRCKLQGKKLVL